MTLSDAIAAADERRSRFESDLFEELRFASVSALSSRRGELLANAEWLVEKLQALGADTGLVVAEGGGNPIVRADFTQDAGAPTITFYGHYDVQPEDPECEWDTPPFEPTVRDGCVYARGAADNKGNHMACLAAVESALAAGNLPLNVRFLLEGEEEVMGDALARYLAANRHDLRTDVVLIWDGAHAPDNRPEMTTGLRGIVNAEIDIETLAADVHSGAYGGVAPNALNTAARIICGLKDDDGRITIPGFYDDVRPFAKQVGENWPEGDLEPFFLQELGARVLNGERVRPPLERLWARPTLDIHGIAGGFTGESVKTVIPARARIKLSMRLVPDQSPERAFEQLVNRVEDLADGVKVGVRRLSTGRPVLLSPLGRYAQVVAHAFESVYRQPPWLRRTGATIPVVADFVDTLDAEVVASGITQYDCRVHAPNERLSLSHFHDGIRVLLNVIFEVAQRGFGF